MQQTLRASIRDVYGGVSWRRLGVLKSGTSQSRPIRQTRLATNSVICRNAMPKRDFHRQAGLDGSVAVSEPPRPWPLCRDTHSAGSSGGATTADGDGPDDDGRRHAEACGRGSAQQRRYATAITFTQIALPALRRAAALEAPDYVRAPGRREYVPVTWDRRDAMGRPIL